MPAVHPVGWDSEALALFDREMDDEVGVGSGMHSQVIGWDDEVTVDFDQVMTDGHRGLLKDSPASDGTTVDVVGVRSSGDVSGTGSPVVYGGVAPGSGIGVTGERDAVSSFGSIGCAVLTSAEACDEERTAAREDGDVVAPDGDLQLMYRHHLLREVGEGVLPERVYEGNYDQLVG